VVRRSPGRCYYSAFGPLRCAVRASCKPRAYILARPCNACVAPLRAAVAKGSGVQRGRPAALVGALRLTLRLRSGPTFGRSTSIRRNQGGGE